MRIGMNLMLWSTAPSYIEMESHLEMLATMGYDCVEIPIYTLESSDIEQFALKCDRLGLEIQAIDVFNADVADIISHDSALRKAAVDRAIECVHKARDIGANVLSGPFFQGLCAPPTKVGPTKEEWMWCVEGLQKIAIEARSCSNVRIACEPLNRFEMHIVNTLERANRLLEETGMDNLGLLADTNHANIEELDVEKSFCKYASKIFNVHISENNRGIPGSGHGIPKSLFKAMVKAGYSGNFIVEAFNCEKDEVLPFLRIWEPFAESKEVICSRSIDFIKSNL